MGSFSLSHWVVVLAIVLILFGAGRIPKAMGDLARGVRAFRTGMREDNATEEGGKQLVEAHRPDQQRAEARPSSRRARRSGASLGLRRSEA
jgi:sec-independent protein translocase protein TatA